MTNTIKAIALVIAGLAVGWLVSVVIKPQASAPEAGGIYNQVQKTFPVGAQIGDRTVFFQSGTIGNGVNQAAYTNNTGRRIQIAAADTHIGWTSGTATSSYRFYVSSSTATSITDYSRPAGTYLLIDGAMTSTSTPATTIITGTTTSAGQGAITLAPGESLIFNVQERYSCKANAACETATSSNRGIDSFFWNFKGTYLP